MQSVWPYLLCALALLSAPLSAADKKKVSKAEREGAEAHMKEELGVNEFTTPSIDTVLQALRLLRPVRYEAVARELPEGTPPDRARLALSAGGVIADGFLAVVAEKQSRIEPVGRALLRHARALGVGDHVTSHARSILERAARKDWQGVEIELTGAQRDVEKGMMALRDEEIAHLVALGGWWRGLEITSKLIVDGYSPERAAVLVQGGTLDYFADRVSTLNPSLKKKPIFVELQKNLAEVKNLTVKEDGSAPTEAEVKRILEIAKVMNAAVSQQE
jgi:hypothetical protein